MFWVYSKPVKLFLFIIIVIFLLGLKLQPSPLQAQSTGASCGDFSLSPQTVTAGQNFNIIKSDGLIRDEVVRATIVQTGNTQVIDCQEDPSLCQSNPTQILSFTTDGFQPNQTYTVRLNYALTNGLGTCDYTLSVVGNQNQYCSDTGLRALDPNSGIETTNFEVNGCASGACSSASLIGIVVTDSNNGELAKDITLNPSSCNPDGTFNIGLGNFDVGVYSTQLYIDRSPTGNIINFSVNTADTPLEGDDCTVASACQLCRGVIQIDDGRSFCSYALANCSSCDSCTPGTCSVDERNRCETSCSKDRYLCVSAGSGQTGIDTAIGCIPFTIISDTTKFFLRWALGIGGGIAILFFIYSSFLIITSSGDPEKLRQGKELLTATITGLLMIIFSVFLLRIIGVNILGIF